MDELLAAIRADILPHFEGLDLHDAAAAASRLQELVPLDGPALTKIRALVDRGAEDGSLLPRENMGVRFGRVAKDESGYSIDAVQMDGPGPKHLHPNGEIDLCFAIEGDPKFCGHAAGWSVFAPGSVHVPTVAGGTMRILYFLPGGAIDFGVE